MLSCKIQPIPTNRTKPKSAYSKLGYQISDCAGAELLVQMKSIAHNEMMRSKPLESPITISIRPTMKLLEQTHMVTRTRRPSILASQHAENSPRAKQPRLNQRSRLVSMDDEEYEPACVTPTSPRPITTIEELAINQSCYLSPDPLSLPQPVLIEKTADDFQKKRKVVGRTLKEGVKWKGTLRKKFSWKSFPELETYLVDHRAEYLQFSSSLNYTKAQKIYNNKLTQGLLDLAASVGYTFEGFSFAAVRDRIRCFYKSYVQATKKKKRSKRGHMM